MNRRNPREIPYFDNLPARAMPALQAAFDKAVEGQFGTSVIHRLFCNDISRLGIDPPLQPVMSQWIDNVRKGDVFRPGGAKAKRPAPVDPQRASVVDEVDSEIVELLERELTPGEETAPKTPFFTPDFPAEETADPTAALIDGMLRDAKAKLARDFEAEAKRIVAQRLRDLANTLEGAH